MRIQFFKLRFKLVMPGYTLSMSLEWFFDEIFQKAISYFKETLSSEAFLIKQFILKLYLGYTLLTHRREYEYRLCESLYSPAE